jgi:hypothetical protein
MEKNDLFSFTSKSQATMFEGVLASPPEGIAKVKANYFLRSEKWDQYLRMWEPNTLPIKSLSDAVNRLGIGTEVYTLLPPQVADAIDRWLIKKGISTNVVAYQDIKELVYDLNINRGITKVYVADQEHYKMIGFRATVVSPKTAWTV